MEYNSTTAIDTISGFHVFELLIDFLNRKDKDLALRNSMVQTQRHDREQEHSEQHMAV